MSEEFPRPRSKISVFTLLGMFFLLSPFLIQAAHASQLDSTLVPEYNFGIATYTGTKFVELHYTPDSSIAKELNGTYERVNFYVNGTGNSDLDPLITKINKNLLEQSASPAQVTKLDLHYTGTIRGKTDGADISLSVNLMLTFGGYVLSNNNSTSGKILVDMNWRGLLLEGPVQVKSPDGILDINSIAGLLQTKHPILREKLLSIQASKEILVAPILDFRDIGNSDLNTWHSLFDPSRLIATPINSADFKG